MTTSVFWKLWAGFMSDSAWKTGSKGYLGAWQAFMSMQKTPVSLGTVTGTGGGFQRGGAPVGNCKR